MNNFRELYLIHPNIKGSYDIKPELYEYAEKIPGYCGLSVGCDWDKEQTLYFEISILDSFPPMEINQDFLDTHFSTIASAKIEHFRIDYVSKSTLDLEYQVG